MKTKKYLVFGGEVYSHHDRRHYYISAANVAELYGVDVRECYFINDWRDAASAYRDRGLITLYPDESGRYTLDTAA